MSAIFRDPRIRAETSVHAFQLPFITVNMHIKRAERTDIKYKHTVMGLDSDHKCTLVCISTLSAMIHTASVARVEHRTQYVVL